MFKLQPTECPKSGRLSEISVLFQLSVEESYNAQKDADMELP